MKIIQDQITRVGEWMQSMPEDKKKAAAFSLAGAVVALNLVLLLAPLLSATYSIQSKIRERAIELKTARENIAKMDQIKALAAKSVEMLQAVEAGVIPADSTAFLKSISEIAQGSGVNIVKLVPIEFKDERFGKPGSPLERFESVGLDIQAQGGYHALGRFVESLENSLVKIQVVDLTVEGNPTRPREHVIDIKLKMIQIKEASRK